MRKAQGMAAGAFVAAGLLLRPLGVVPTPTANGQDKDGKQANSGILRPRTEAGPWIASCMYWAPMQKAVDQEPDSENVLLALNANHAHVNLDTQADEDDTDPGGCSQENMGSGSSQPDTVARWGFPEPGTDLKVHAIIAIVTDPVRTHQALEFDRSIDVLIQAAGENGYVPSFFWLPWKAKKATLVRETIEAAVDEKEENPSAQPGLIIFKRDGSDKSRNASGSLSPVIYLFLIGATPTQGVDGIQLAKAFKYEQDIHEILPNFDLSPNEGSKYVNIIGPANSQDRPRPCGARLSKLNRRTGARGNC